MTFTEIVNEVADRLNLSDATTLTRIGRSVNERYGWVTSSVGLQTTVQTTATANTVVGNQSVTFTTIDKVYAVYNPAYTPPSVLDEVTVDQIRNMPRGTDPPSCYAIQLMGSSSVTIKLNSVPSTIYALGADGEADQSTLSGANQPAFSARFHNMLVYGAMATELDKMEKYEFAKKQEALYEQRLSDLRLFIAISAYRDVWQGKTRRTPRGVQLI